MSWMFLSSITSILKTQNKGAKLGTTTSMNQVLWRTHLLEISLMGFFSKLQILINFQNSNFSKCNFQIIFQNSDFQIYLFIYYYYFIFKKISFSNNYSKFQILSLIFNTSIFNTSISKFNYLKF